MEGVDYSFSKPTAAGLAAAGKRFAMAYVGPGSAGKHFTTAEVADLHAHGIATVLLAEGTVGASGYDVGRLHAQQAVAMAVTRGFPTRVIYFAVDRDVSVTTWPAARVYGERDVMMWAARDGVASWFFQTFAWSGGAWYSGNHVEQYRNGVMMAGGQVDLCRSMRPDFGQWPIDPGEDLDVTPYEHELLEALAFRDDTFAAMSTTITGGPYAGTPHKGVIAILALGAKIDALAMATGIDPEALEAAVSAAVAAQIPAIADAVADEDHARSAD